MTLFENAYIQAIILGLVQGLTEFLPVSSSGHLVIVQTLLGVDGPTLSFDVMLHFGTLIAVLIALKDDWMPIVNGVLGDEKYKVEGRRRLVHLIIASIPVAFVGFVFRDVLEPLFSSAKLVGWMLLATGVTLWFSDHMTRQKKVTKELADVTAFDALLIGVGQMLAIVPGLSRSGSTMGAGLIRGLSREAAARFAFLLAIPAIAGATLLELPAFFRTAKEDLLAMLVGTAIAAIAGYFAITFFIKMIRRGSLRGYAVYTWTVGIIVLLSTRG